MLSALPDFWQCAEGPTETNSKEQSSCYWLGGFYERCYIPRCPLLMMHFLSLLQASGWSTDMKPKSRLLGSQLSVMTGNIFQLIKLLTFIFSKSGGIMAISWDINSSYVGVNADCGVRFYDRDILVYYKNSPSFAMCKRHHFPIMSLFHFDLRLLTVQIRGHFSTTGKKRDISLVLLCWSFFFKHPWYMSKWICTNWNVVSVNRKLESTFIRWEYQQF